MSMRAFFHITFAWLQINVGMMIAVKREQPTIFEGE